MVIRHILQPLPPLAADPVHTIRIVKAVEQVLALGTPIGLAARSTLELMSAPLVPHAELLWALVYAAPAELPAAPPVAGAARSPFATPPRLAPLDVLSCTHDKVVVRILNPLSRLAGCQMIRCSAIGGARLEGCNGWMGTLQQLGFAEDTYADGTVIPLETYLHWLQKPAAAGAMKVQPADVARALQALAVVLEAAILAAPPFVARAAPLPVAVAVPEATTFIPVADALSTVAPVPLSMVPPAAAPAPPALPHEIPAAGVVRSRDPAAAIEASAPAAKKPAK